MNERDLFFLGRGSTEERNTQSERALVQQEVKQVLLFAAHVKCKHVHSRLGFRLGVSHSRLWSLYHGITMRTTARLDLPSSTTVQVPLDEQNHPHDEVGDEGRVLVMGRSALSSHRSLRSLVVLRRLLRSGSTLPRDSNPSPNEPPLEQKSERFE